VQAVAEKEANHSLYTGRYGTYDGLRASLLQRLAGCAASRADGRVEDEDTVACVCSQYPLRQGDITSTDLITSAHSTFTTPISQSACTEIPSWYLISTLDQCHPVAFQEFVAASLAKMEVVERIEAGHSAMLSQPDKVADFIARAARS